MPKTVQHGPADPAGDSGTDRGPAHRCSARESDCGGHDIAALLRGSGLRPTRQRIALAQLLFAGEDRHVTAESLHAEATGAGEHVSLATVYNTLHQFCGAELVRELAIDGTRAYFDTNISNHSHFYIEATGELVDIPFASIAISGLPQLPAGMEIAHIDVVVRLVKA